MRSKANLPKRKKKRRERGEYGTYRNRKVLEVAFFLEITMALCLLHRSFAGRFFLSSKRR